MTRNLVAVAALILALGVGRAEGATIAFDNTTPVSIPGLTGFETDGSDMAGMEVTATFANGLIETLFWAATGATSGGVTGTGWSLSLTGDSFANPWTFDFSADLQLTSIELNGATGLTVFDITWDVAGDTFGTPGSFNGTTFVSTHPNDGSIVATYSNPIGIGLNAPIGDIFQVLFLDFSQAAVRTDFTFVQDTDNDERLAAVPEPATLTLLGLGLAGLARARRRSPNRRGAA